VAVVLNIIKYKGAVRRYAQISTVMTLPEYRNAGLNRRIIETILDEWRDKCDAVYLLANDSVTDYYPRFGFGEFTEYDFTARTPAINANVKKTEIVKLNLNDQSDCDLIMDKYEGSNPFEELSAYNPGLFLFHCHYFLSDHIYYISDYDAVAIAKREGENITLYGLFAESGRGFDEIMTALAGEWPGAGRVSLGFTPASGVPSEAEPSREEDNHLFVLLEKENIFKDNKVKFPLLSRA